MSARIYHSDNNLNWLPMEEAPYESEKLLQELLAEHPDLLAGEQINSDQPRRWVLVTREMSVSGEQDGSAQWSVDHLFLDQDAIPTLVEVKKSTNSDIRRKVIGQMLDYAANAVVRWPVEEIQAKFLGRCQKENIDADDKLAELFGEDEGKNLAAFWQKVKTNLQAGRVRMVFVADDIPPELRTIVEFLNAQMDPAEVLAIEIKQFAGEGGRTLVPRVLGQTEAARQKRGGTQGAGKTSWTDWESALAEVSNTDVVAFFKREIEKKQEDYIPHGALRYRIADKRRFSVEVKQEHAYVWQSGRFDNDVAFWQQSLSHRDNVKPVNSGQCLSFSLYTADDFEFFFEAATHTLQSKHWRVDPADDEIEETEADDPIMK